LHPFCDSGFSLSLRLPRMSRFFRRCNMYQSATLKHSLQERGKITVPKIRPLLPSRAVSVQPPSRSTSRLRRQHRVFDVVRGRSKCIVAGPEYLNLSSLTPPPLFTSGPSLVNHFHWCRTHDMPVIANTNPIVAVTAMGLSSSGSRCHAYDTTPIANVKTLHKRKATGRDRKMARMSSSAL